MSGGAAGAGLEVVRVKSKRCIDVWARPYRRQASCQHCGGSELRIKATHKRTVKHTRRGNQVMILHLKVPKYHCQGCGRHFCHRCAGLRARYRSSDTYQMEVYEAHDGGVTRRKLSGTHMMSGATVERWYRDHLGIKRSEMDRRRCPRVLERVAKANGFSLHAGVSCEGHQKGKRERLW